MTKFLTLTVLFILFSCASKETHVSYDMMIADTKYEFNVLTEGENQTYVATTLVQDLKYLPLLHNPSDPKVLESPAEFNGSQWHHKKYPTVTFVKVVMAPYYGMYAYNLVSNLNTYEGGIFSPNCPPQTKYLALFYHNTEFLPLIGCVIEKNNNI